MEGGGGGGDGGLGLLLAVVLATLCVVSFVIFSCADGLPKDKDPGVGMVNTQTYTGSAQGCSAAECGAVCGAGCGA